MTCFMVFYHIGKINEPVEMVGIVDSHINDLLNSLFTCAGMLVMSHFFAVTGFLLFNKLSYKNYPEKIKRRLFTLLIPYIIWQIIIVIIDILQGQYTFDLTSFLKSVFLLVRWPINGAMWYVYAVFLLAILSPILLLLFQSKLRAVLSVIILTIMAQSRTLITDPRVGSVINYGYLPNILMYLPAYLIGALFGYYYDDNNEKDFLRYPLYIVLISFLLDGTFQGFFTATVRNMLPIVSIIVLPNTKILLRDRWIYKLSFLMYAIHQPLIIDYNQKIKDMIFQMGGGTNYNQKYS